MIVELIVYSMRKGMKSFIAIALVHFHFTVVYFYSSQFHYQINHDQLNLNFTLLNCRYLHHFQ